MGRSSDYMCHSITYDYTELYLFSNHYRCRLVCVVSDVHVCVPGSFIINGIYKA